MTSDTGELLGFELSIADKRILELNHNGYSSNKISERLKAEGIILSQAGVIRHLRELRQDPDNNVQVNYIRNSFLNKPKEEQKWYSVVSRVKDYLPEYKRVWGTKASARTTFYAMQDEGLVTANDNNRFHRVMVEARLGWVDADGNLLYPKLDIDCFSDEEDHSKTAGRYDNYAPLEPGSPPNPDEYVDNLISEVEAAEEAVETARAEAEKYLEDCKGALFDAPNDYNGIGMSGRKGGLWYGQPEIVEVWEEKVDLVGNFEELLKGWGIKIRGNGGYPSLLFLNLCMELKELIDTYHLQPEHIHIKYCGDWDPSGKHIDYYIQKRLKQLGISGIDFKRIAVTPKQIEDFDLPLMNIEKNPDKKMPNPNLAEFKRENGNKATHLNALMITKHKDDFKKILDDAIRPHWSKEIYQKMVDDYDDVVEEIDDIKGVREEIRRKVIDAGYDVDNVVVGDDDSEDDSSEDSTSE